MAKPACSNVNPDGTFIDVRLGDNEMAQAAVLEELDSLRKQRPRAGDGSGTKRDFQERAARDLRAMLPMSPKQLEEYMVAQGWFRLDKNKELQPGAAMKRFEGEMGYVNAVMKVYLEGRSQAVKQLADNFLMKTKLGEPAVQGGAAVGSADAVHGPVRGSGHVHGQGAGGWPGSVRLHQGHAVRAL